MNNLKIVSTKYYCVMGKTKMRILLIWCAYVLCGITIYIANAKPSNFQRLTLADIFDSTRV